MSFSDVIGLDLIALQYTWSLTLGGHDSVVFCVGLVAQGREPCKAPCSFRKIFAVCFGQKFLRSVQIPAGPHILSPLLQWQQKDFLLHDQIYRYVTSSPNPRKSTKLDCCKSCFVIPNQNQSLSVVAKILKTAAEKFPSPNPWSFICCPEGMFLLGICRMHNHLAMGPFVIRYFQDFSDTLMQLTFQEKKTVSVSDKSHRISVCGPQHPYKIEHPQLSCFRVASCSDFNVAVPGLESRDLWCHWCIRVHNYPRYVQTIRALVSMGGSLPSH